MHFDPTFRDDIWEDVLWQQAMIPLTLPEPGNYGQIRVAREAAQYIPLYGKQLMLSAQAPWTLVYEGTTLLMSDTPQERLMMLRGTTGMYGHVLVAGGGLGLYPQYLRRYRRAEQVTVIEHNVDVVTMLETTLGPNAAIEIVQTSFEQFLAQAGNRQFDCCYIDVHPTIDPRWLPGLNWLRDRCAEQITGPLRVWGYHWMVRELVSGLEKHYIPQLCHGKHFDDDLSHALIKALPAEWTGWSDTHLHAWLERQAHQIAWPLEFGG
ncbi:MAG: hypothetical protein JXB30_15245 [Anaerolineae bacterium]|nr:hypothetical protein [Anaerolineae bacterium]